MYLFLFNILSVQTLELYWGRLAKNEPYDVSAAAFQKQQGLAPPKDRPNLNELFW